MNQNKTTKYFKYAIGEIVLVVIGILIAVIINSQYNKSENERNIQAILRQVQDELITDIKDAKRIYNEYISKDEVFRKIMLDSSLIKMHQKEPFSFLITNYYVSFSNKKGGYERIMNNIENLPEDYKFLLPHFNHLYVELQNDIDDYNKFIKDAVINNIQSAYLEEPNYSRYVWDIKSQEEAINYYMNDPFLKNKNAYFINALSNIQQAANDYRIESIVLYHKIDSLIGNKSEIIPDELKIIPNEAWMQPYLGQYSNIDNPDDENIELSFKNDQLMLNDDPLFWHEKDIFFVKEGRIVVKLFSDANNNYFVKISVGAILNQFKKIPS